jgi:hypothetical protein
MAEYFFGSPVASIRLASESGLTGSLVLRYESGPLVDVTASWEAAATANDLSIVVRGQPYRVVDHGALKTTSTQ